MRLDRISVLNELSEEMKEFHYLLILLTASLVEQVSSITMDQFMKSLDMMRNGCLVKFPKVPIADLDKFRGGELPTDITKDFKCYTRCVAQLGGVLNKKGEIGIQRSLAQMQIIVPKEMHENTGGAINNCTEVREYPFENLYIKKENETFS